MDLIDLSALSWSDYFDYRHDIRVDRERTFRCYTCLPDKLPCPPPLPLKAGMQPKTLEKEVEISSVSSTFIRRLIAEKHSSFFVFLHGGGHSSLTWAMVSEYLC